MLIFNTPIFNMPVFMGTKIVANFQKLLSGKYVMLRLNKKFDIMLLLLTLFYIYWSKPF